MQTRAQIGARARTKPAANAKSHSAYSRLKAQLSAMLCDRQPNQGLEVDSPRRHLGLAVAARFLRRKNLDGEVFTKVMTDLLRHSQVKAL
jgi:hypothetical protein